ncbi:FMN reductase [Amycolatopsis sp.]|uniref:FMN reductase n=1 Tax=Amycolatopsis sp. TaxID=37632 RepID=UPI002C8B5DA6|nr:FMN reductase [Amycolatopsis sp.]HVV08619.1 FMN reductase [Amycolatopsis sp.]
MSEFTIVAVSGGLNQPSSTRLLADRLSSATVTALEAEGATAKVETIELRDIAHDIVNTMLTGFPAGKMPAVFDAVAGASGLIAVTPVFTTSYSGLFKSFVDVLDNESLTGMPVLLGATGGTARHSLALDYNLRPVFTYLHADVVTTGVFAATGDWADSVNPLPKRIERAGGELAAKILSSRRAGAVDEYAGVPSFEQLLGR